MGLISGFVTFVIGALVGGLGIYAGGRLVVNEGSYEQAVTVAIVGALVWGLTEAFLGWVPLLGAVLTLIVYLLVLNVSYSGGWTDAAAIAVVAWVTVLAVQVLLGTFLGVVPGIGVPGI